MVLAYLITDLLNDVTLISPLAPTVLKQLSVASLKYSKDLERDVKFDAGTIGVLRRSATRRAAKSRRGSKQELPRVSKKYVHSVNLGYNDVTLGATFTPLLLVNTEESLQFNPGNGPSLEHLSKAKFLGDKLQLPPA